jgi:hypothetical protein
VEPAAPREEHDREEVHARDAVEHDAARDARRADPLAGRERAQRGPRRHVDVILPEGGAAADGAERETGGE